MQDIQNIPNPDVDSFENEEDFGSHSDVQPDSRTDRDSQDMDIERPGNPVPPGDQSDVSIEEPPDERKPPIDEDNTERQRLV